VPPVPAARKVWVWSACSPMERSQRLAGASTSIVSPGSPGSGSAGGAILNSSQPASNSAVSRRGKNLRAALIPNVTGCELIAALSFLSEVGSQHVLSGFVTARGCGYKGFAGGGLVVNADQRPPIVVEGLRVVAGKADDVFVSALGVLPPFLGE